MRPRAYICAAAGAWIVLVAMSCAPTQSTERKRARPARADVAREAAAEAEQAAGGLPKSASGKIIEILVKPDGMFRFRIASDTFLIKTDARGADAMVALVIMSYEKQSVLHVYEDPLHPGHAASVSVRN